MRNPILRSHLLTLLLIAAPTLASRAVNVYPSPHQDEKEAFAVYFSKTYWQPSDVIFDPLYEHINSTSAFGGQFWTIDNAVYGSSNYIGIGSPFYPLTSTLTSESCISDKIALASLYLDINYKSKGSTDNIEEIALLVADSPDLLDIEINPDLTDVDKYTSSDPIQHDSFMNFRIDDSKVAADRCYALRFKTNTYTFNDGVNDDLIRIKSLTFYRRRRESPTITLTGNYIEVVSESGELHMIADEYDSDGTFIGPVHNNLPASAPSRTTAPRRVVTPGDWSAPYTAARDVVTKIPAPADNHFIWVHSKSKKEDGTFSNTVSELFNTEGVVVSTPTLLDDDCEKASGVEYYDLQGRRLSAPGNGLIIVKNPTGVRKLIINNR